MQKIIKCINCDNMILEITAKRQDGLCGPCFCTESEKKACSGCGKLTPKGTLQHNAGLCRDCFIARLADKVGVDIEDLQRDG